MTEEPLLKMRGIKLEGRSDETWNPIINGVDLTLAKGEVLGLIGESGASTATTVGAATTSPAGKGCRRRQSIQPLVTSYMSSGTTEAYTHWTLD